MKLSIPHFPLSIRTMLPKSYLQSFAANVSKRSGISRATVEVVLPHVFDEIRHQLTEGTLCVPIESFGTFAVVEYPERKRRYTYKGVDEIRTLPAQLKLKFAPTRNMRREIDAQHFDPERRSFQRHPDDPAIRKRRNMKYNKRSEVYFQAVGKNESPHFVSAYETLPPRRRRRSTDASSAPPLDSAQIK